ncbi:hypothetical protein GCM10022243_31390 [Saccharothrix violaceirubra]|uniref:DNA-binding SARP family transcriptional activator n=1 Tax=Saccharothrix violaceirubra TaxID=413306 RepID=A0A7W7T548_9PSEU|nr:BTAD domain-containing putative transcriptional regulator [Saccharothrix violaceirubra]MBB4966763.1 DNA-binding SARP family transcriptional activator [Saccharothrix violaceirubra]
MRFRLLGALDVRDATGAVVFVGPRQRAILAALLLRANEVASVGYLADAAWEVLPAKPHSNVRTYISGLRRRLGDGPGSGERLLTRPGGYVLRVAPAELDLTVFEELAGQGERAMLSGDLHRAVQRFEESLGQWRGKPLEGLSVGTPLRAELSRLEERRLTVVERHGEAAIGLGRHEGLIANLRLLVEDYPFRERLWAQLMLALNLAGRQAEALRAFHDARRMLDEELGVDPGPELGELHQRILRGEIEPAPPVSARILVGAAPDDGRTAVTGGGRRGVPSATASDPAPSQLPPDIGDFVGREPELRQVIDRLTHEDDTMVLPVAVLSGQRGIGKTTLAVHVAHRLRCHYPDGQLYLDLGGSGSVPRDARSLLTQLLRSLGIVVSDPAVDLADLSGLFRAGLAGRRVLIVLDDAVRAEQVRPLLPGDARCGVIITSQSRLTDLPATVRVRLPPLTETDAVELLGEVAGAHRLRSGYDDAVELVRLCDALPLAVRAAGARLAAKPHWPIGQLVFRLSDEHHRLDRLDIGDLTVRARLAASYGSLDATTQRAFCLVSLMESDEFRACAAAPLLEVPVGKATDLLEALVDAQLIEATPARDGIRYRMPVLVRLYAREKAVTMCDATS